MILDPSSLTRHAVCLGMTGSGKTGLCVGLLEDLAQAGVPILAVDPKGDLAPAGAGAGVGVRGGRAVAA